MKTNAVKSTPPGGGHHGAERGVHAASTSKNRKTVPLATAPDGQSIKQAKAPAPRAAKLWQLRLYVIGQTPKSLAALANLKTLCESKLKGGYRITVIDLQKHPQLAKGDQILAVPTVVRKLPKPVRTVLGDLSDTDHLLVGLDLRSAR